MKKRYGIKLHKPSKNLGCAGISIGELAYIDVFRIPHNGCFANILGRKLWLSFNSFKFEGRSRMLQFRIRTWYAKRLIHRIYK